VVQFETQDPITKDIHSCSGIPNPLELKRDESIPEWDGSSGSPSSGQVRLIAG